MHSRHCGEKSVTTWSPGAHARDALADRLDDARALVPEHGRRVARRDRRRSRCTCRCGRRRRPRARTSTSPGFGSGELDVLDDEGLAELLENSGSNAHMARRYHRGLVNRPRARHSER